MVDDSDIGIEIALGAALFLAAAAALVLARRAVLHWWSQRAGRPYELPEDRLGTALRAGAASGAALVAAALAVPLLSAPAPAPARTAAATTRPATAPVPPPPPPRTPEPAPPAPAVRTLGHPAGGTLQALRDGTRVWLPPRYDTPPARDVAYPVVVAHVPAGGDGDVYDGFAGAVRSRVADSFLLVMPPDCGRDTGAVLAEAGRRYRTLTARTARGVIGVGDRAACAVRAAFAAPDRYGAAAGVSGMYPALRPGPHPALLLAAGSGETAARAAALRLRDALRPQRGRGAGRRRGDVRVVDSATTRRDLIALVAGFLTEKLDGPTRIRPTTESQR